MGLTQKRVAFCYLNNISYITESSTNKKQKKSCQIAASLSQGGKYNKACPFK